MDTWSMSGRVQAPYRDGGVPGDRLLDVYSNVEVLASSEAEAIANGAREIAERNGGNPDMACWVGTPPAPWNRSESMRRAAYNQFDWCI